MESQAEKVGDGTFNWKGEAATKKRTGSWIGSSPMLVLEVSETTTYFAVSSNLVTYMTTVLHQGVAKSARNVNNWSGTLFLSSVLGGFLSDAYWGQYKTLSVSIIIYALGIVGLTLSASLRNLRPSQCPAQNHTCSPASPGQLAVFFGSLYVVAVSCGSLKANLISFGANQFDENDAMERKQKQSFFNWLVCSIDVGGVIAVTLLVYIQDRVGWGLGFGILLVGILAAVPVYFIQTSKYRYRRAEGSPLTKVAQVLVAAFRKRKIQVDGREMHEDVHKKAIPLTNHLRFLDRAAVKLSSDGATMDPWRITTVTQVEEVKLVVRLVPIWISTLFVTVVASQALTFFVTQGTNMNNKLGSFKVPPASMLIFANLSQLAFLTLYDRLLLPQLRKVTGKDRGITLLQKIGAGMVLNIAGITVAALVEMRRRSSEDKLHIWWLVPQYALLGIGEGLSASGAYEFFHDEAPDDMRSLGTSMALANVGAGNFVSSLIITCVKSAAPSWLQNDINKGHVDYFFWLLAALASAFMLVFYIPLSLWYTYKGVRV